MLCQKALLYIWLHKICWQYSISPNFLHSVITFLFLVKIEDSYLVFVQFSLFKILYWHYSFRRVTGNYLECNLPYLSDAIFLVSNISILAKYLYRLKKEKFVDHREVWIYIYKLRLQNFPLSLNLFKNY